MNTESKKPVEEYANWKAPETGELAPIDWEPYIKENLEDFDVTVATGSNSASLPGFLKSGGLVPTGELLQREDIVPFSGELEIGISESGVNMTSVSLSRSIRDALKYSQKDFNQAGWNPDKGDQNIQQYEISAKNLPTEHQRLVMPILQKRIDIERKRLAIWKTLNVNEQGLIEEPFPIVYGVSAISPDVAAQKFQIARADIPGEVFHSGSIPLRSESRDSGKLVVFVPQVKVESVKRYLAQSTEEKTEDFAVQPLEALKYMAEKTAFPYGFIQRLKNT